MSKKPGGNNRFSTKRKTAAILRLLRGEDLEFVSREYKVTAATLSQWREAFFAAGQTGLQYREADVRDVLGVNRRTVVRFRLPNGPLVRSLELRGSDGKRRLDLASRQFFVAQIRQDPVR